MLARTAAKSQGPRRVERTADALALEEVVAAVEPADRALVEDRVSTADGQTAVTPTPNAAASEPPAANGPVKS